MLVPLRFRSQFGRLTWPKEATSDTPGLIFPRESPRAPLCRVARAKSPSRHSTLSPWLSNGDCSGSPGSC
eukprot:4298108-Pyramimonas_sp.AAC.1